MTFNLFSYLKSRKGNLFTLKTDGYISELVYERIMIDWGIPYDLTDLNKAPVSGLFVVAGEFSLLSELLKKSRPLSEESRIFYEKMGVKPYDSIEYELRISLELLKKTEDPHIEYIKLIFGGLSSVFRENTDVPEKLFDKLFNLAWYKIRKDQAMVAEFEEGLGD